MSKLQINNARRSKTTALLLIDFQEAFVTSPAYFGGSISSNDIPATVTALLSFFRAHHLYILHVKHNSLDRKAPLHISNPGNAIRDFAAPVEGEPLFTKSVNSSFVGTNLEQVLREKGVKRLVVGGTTTEHCVSTTVRMGANMDVVGSVTGDGEILLVSDACAAFEKPGIDAETVHKVNLATLDNEFCRIVTTDEVLSMLEKEE